MQSRRLVYKTNACRNSLLPGSLRIDGHGLLRCQRADFDLFTPSLQAGSRLQAIPPVVAIAAGNPNRAGVRRNSQRHAGNGQSCALHQGVRRQSLCGLLLQLPGGLHLMQRQKGMRIGACGYQTGRRR